MNGGKLRGSEWSQESILTQLGVKNWTKYRVFKKQPSCLFCVCRNMGNFVFKTPLRFLWNPDIKVDAKKRFLFFKTLFSHVLFLYTELKCTSRCYADLSQGLRHCYTIATLPLPYKSYAAATQVYASWTSLLRSGMHCHCCCYASLRRSNARFTPWLHDNIVCS